MPLLSGGFAGRNEMPLLVESQGSPAWHAARAGKITASTAAGCLGLDEDAGPVATYRRIKGLTKVEDNPYLQHGRDNEHKARSEYEVLTGRLAVETGFWVHPLYDWLGASPDGLVGGEDEGGLECKCPVKELPTEVPQKHWVQCQVNMIVCNRNWWDYLAWNELLGVFGPVRIERDGAIEFKILGLLKLFWEMYLSKDQEPPLQRKKLFAGVDVKKELFRVMTPSVQNGQKEM